MDYYNRYVTLLESVGYHAYLHANEYYFMLEPFTDQARTISDQNTPEEWEVQFRTSEEIGQRFKLYQNPTEKRYILELSRFGENASIPDGFFLTETDPGPLSQMLKTVVNNALFSAKHRESFRTEVGTSEVPEYTKSQVVTLVRMIRGDLNTPGNEEVIKRLLAAIK